jgi:hypothetical protein
MTLLYMLAVWAHIFTVALWIGAMFFEDPYSTRFFCRLINRMHGIGWYAQGVLWSTGYFMMRYHGLTIRQVFSYDYIGSPRGQAAWVKIFLVLVLAGFQVAVGHKPSKLIYGYILVIFTIVGISVMLIRPGVLY